MELSKRIITSPVMKIEDLIASYITAETINYSKFIDALIRGDYEAYKVAAGDDFGVISTFKVDSVRAHSPLLNLRVLALFKATKQAGRNIEERHLTVQSVTQYFEALGVDTINIESCLKELVFLRLLEPYDPSVNILDDDQKIAITYKGLAHYDLSTRNSVYFYQMALTTAIVDPEATAEIRKNYKSNRSFGDITSNVRKVFADYLINEDEKHINQAQDKEQFECQNELVKDIKVFGLNKAEDFQKNQNIYAAFVGKNLSGKILRYDPEKDFGFVSLPEINDDVYLKVSMLEKNELDAIYDGDIIYCTLIEGIKGVRVNAINGLVEDENKISIENCSIKFYKKDRAYGFAIIGNTSNEAFFHKTAFSAEFYDLLKDGLNFKAEVRLNDDGKYQVRRCIELLK